MEQWNSINGKDVMTPEYVRHLFKLGSQCNNKDELYDLLSNHHQCDSVGNAMFGGYYYAKGKWTTDFTLEEKVWHRYGDVRYDNNSGDFCSSVNHSEQRKENGVSVMDEDWKRTVSAGFFKGDVYEVRGIQVAWGSDGEPLIVPTSIPRLVQR